MGLYKGCLRIYRVPGSTTLVNSAVLDVLRVRLQDSEAT